MLAIVEANNIPHLWVIGGRGGDQTEMGGPEVRLFVEMSSFLMLPTLVFVLIVCDAQIMRNMVGTMVI